MSERLQKILARAGYGSRRSAEALILAGRVSVNGVHVTALGAQADAGTDTIAVDGAIIEPGTPTVYLALNKPVGYITTAMDPQRRRTVMELLPPALPPHVLPIGRLDQDTSGLLLFTDDGTFAHRMSHPRFQIEKEYLALVTGSPAAPALDALRRGIMLDGRRTAQAEADFSPPPHGFSSRDGQTWLRIVIHEGRKRQVRLMCATVGHPVRALVRTRIGPIALARLASGKTRILAAEEVAALRAVVGLTAG